MASRPGVPRLEGLLGTGEFNVETAGECQVFARCLASVNGGCSLMLLSYLIYLLIIYLVGKNPFSFFHKIKDAFFLFINNFTESDVF